MKKSKPWYQAKIKGKIIDVYDILYGFKVTDPAINHLIKKAIRFGRGKKSRKTDTMEILQTAYRLVESDKTLRKQLKKWKQQQKTD